MKPIEYNTGNTSTIIDENAGLQEFYKLTNQLSRNRKVRFTNKLDEADSIEWNFKYRGNYFSLQYNIYSGVTLAAQDSKNVKTVKVVYDLAKKLKDQRA